MQQEFEKAFAAEKYLTPGHLTAEKELAEYQAKFTLPTPVEVRRLVVLEFNDPRLQHKMALTERYRIMNALLAKMKKGTKQYKSLFNDLQLIRQAYTAYGDKVQITFKS